jgi:hypothetical protein
MNSSCSNTAWVEFVRDLQQRGLIEEARRELENLRAAYPDFSVPQDLSEALRLPE